GGPGEPDATDFSDFAQLCAVIDDDDADSKGFLHPLPDDLVPYYPARVVPYVGSPGNWVDCPHCHQGGRRVDDRGGYSCARCGFSNLHERPDLDGEQPADDDDDALRGEL